MGNCLVLQNKVIKVMKTDEAVLEYRAPAKVLSEYSLHAISNTLPVEQYLSKDSDMIGGQLYYLPPLPLPQLNLEKKMLPNTKLELVENVDDGNDGVLRIKLVMSKKELEVMLKNGGVSVRDLISQLKGRESPERFIELNDERNENCKQWKPILESIPELE